MSAWIQFLVYSNIWIALGAGLVTYANSKDLDYSILISAGTLFLYSSLRLIKLKHPHTKNHRSPRQEWLITHSTLFYLVLVASMVGILYGGLNRLELLLSPTVWGLITVSFLYAIPVFPKGKRFYALREFPLAKVFLVGFVWAMLCWYLPDRASYGAFWEGFFYIVAITIPFDIRDLSYDASYMKTIPQLMGAQASTILALALLCVGYLFLPDSIKLPMLFTYMLTAIFIWVARNKKSDFYFSFLLDGLLLVYGINLLI